MRVATDYLKGRIVEANLADLNKDEDQNYRKIRLQLLVRINSLHLNESASDLTCMFVGCGGQALPEQLLRHGYDYRQDPIACEEMAGMNLNL